MHIVQIHLFHGQSGLADCLQTAPLLEICNASLYTLGGVILDRVEGGLVDFVDGWTLLYLIYTCLFDKHGLFDAIITL